MTARRGCIFLEQVRASNFTPEFHLSTSAGVLVSHGLPVRRGRIRLDSCAFESTTREVPAEVAARVTRFLQADPMSHVVVVHDHYPGLAAVVAEALPDAQIAKLGTDDFPSPAELERWVRGQGRWLPVERAHVGMRYEEAGALLRQEGFPLVVACEELTPEIPSTGVDGDLFLDHLCYYRAPYEEGRHAPLVGTSSCSFCDIAQPSRRSAPPDPAALVPQLRAYERDRPEARSFHLFDAGVTNHVDEVARVIAREAARPLEICIDTRAPAIVRSRARIERALATLDGTGHVLNFYCTGFETFSAEAFSRLNKGYPVLENVECLLLFDALKHEHPASFESQRPGAHGFINFTPWTTTDDLATNAYFAHALGFHRWCRSWHLSKLRIFDSLPIARLAEADGVFIDAYDDPRDDTALRLGYRAERPWRFLDPRVARVARWTFRLMRPWDDEERAWFERLQRAACFPRNDAWTTRVFAAILRAAADDGPADEPLASFAGRVEAAIALPDAVLFPARRVLGVAPSPPPSVPAPRPGAQVPSCCADARRHRTARTTDELRLLALSVAATKGAPRASLDPWAPWSAAPYLPCRLDCPAALATSPPRPADARAALPQLVLSPRGRLVLHGASPVEGGYGYVSAEPVGDDPLAAACARALEGGDRVTFHAGLLLAWRGERLHAAIPCDLAVPYAEGERSRFGWLARAADPWQPPDATAPSRATWEIVGPAQPGERTRARFEAACKSAATGALEALDVDGLGRALVFDDGEFAFFRGDVKDDAGAVSVRFEALLRHRLPADSSRKNAYRHVRAGATLAWGADGAAKDPSFALRLGPDCDLVVYRASGG